MAEKPHSRRKFLKYIGAGAVVAVAGLVVEQQVLPQVLRPAPAENKYPQGLSIEQKISPEIVEYPPVKFNVLDLTITLQNTIPVKIENITFKISGLKGFEPKSVKYQDKEIPIPKLSDNGDLVLNLPDESLQSRWIRDLQLTFEGGWNSQTTDITTQMRGQYYPEGTNGSSEGYLDTISNQIKTTIQVTPVPKTLRELYQQGQQDWVKDILDRKLLLQYPVQAELQEKYWRNPNEENSQEVVEYFYLELEKTGEPYSELVTELHKLPDLKDPKYDTDLVKSLENISTLCLFCETPKENIQKMLDEGIKEKRKYCTPLQALFWLSNTELFSKENNPINPYDIKRLLSTAWDPTFGGEEWKDYDTVKDRVNFPLAVCYFMAKNIKTVDYENPFIGIRPQVVFDRKWGECIDQSTLAAYLLLGGGYEAELLEVDWNRDVVYGGHVVCKYVDKDGRLYTIDDYPHEDIAIHLESYISIYGPYDSVDSIVSEIASVVRRRHGNIGPISHKIYSLS